MSNIIIHYFTGTGNTALAADQISGQLKAAGHKVYIRLIRKNDKPLLDSFDYHIIAFPVLAMSAPVMVKRYIRKMAEGGNAKAAVLAVNGAVFDKGKLIKGFTGQALQQAERLLKRRNYDVFLTGDASFPANWTQTFNPCTSAESDEIIKHGKDEVQKFIDKFLSGKKYFYRTGVLSRIWSFMAACLFGLIGRRVLGKFYIAGENCSGCAVCAKSCPAGTIRMRNKKPIWGVNCEDCNRCINVCPEKAIQVSIPVFIMHSIINIGLTLTAIIAILIHTPKLIPVALLPLVCLEVLMIILAVIVFMWVSFVPIDAVFQLFLRIPAVRRFCSFSYTDKFRRYTAPGFKPPVM